MHDEPVAPSAGQIIVGAPLDDLSIDELNARISALRGEIGRVEAMLESKQHGRAAAEAVFGKP